MSRSVAPPRVVNIEDLRRLAKRRLPRFVFDYIDGGADAEITLRENCRAFDDVTFRPRQRVATPAPDLRTTVLGTPLALPFILAPVGSSRMFYPRGEEAAAARARARPARLYMLVDAVGLPAGRRQGGDAGPGVVSGVSVRRTRRRVARRSSARAAPGTPRWSSRSTRRSPACASATSATASKELLTRRPWPMLPYVWQFLARPALARGFLGDGGLMSFPNVMLPDGPMPYADVGAALEQSIVTWRDLRWIRDLWKGPIVVKGVHTGDDARRAIDAGRQRGRRVEPRRPAARWRARRPCACCRKSSRRSADGSRC